MTRSRVLARPPQRQPTMCAASGPVPSSGRQASRRGHASRRPARHRPSAIPASPQMPRRFDRALQGGRVDCRPFFRRQPPLTSASLWPFRFGRPAASRGNSNPVCAPPDAAMLDAVTRRIRTTGTSACSSHAPRCVEAVRSHTDPWAVRQRQRRAARRESGARGVHVGHLLTPRRLDRTPSTAPAAPALG